LKDKLFHFSEISDFENYFRNLGYYIIAGIDEAGRGALAGPVFAAAVILPSDFKSSEIKDSKILPSKKREELFEYICQVAVDYAISSIEVKEINQKGISQSVFKAMLKALNSLKVKPQLVLIDGPWLIPGYQGLQKAIINGDKKCISISAASILAKVARDRYMKNLDKIYPQYEFSQHKGYATKSHFEKIKKYGLCPFHRTYFKCLKK